MTLCQKEYCINKLSEDFLHTVEEILNWLKVWVFEIINDMLVLLGYVAH